jgi:hypothetical protein
MRKAAKRDIAEPAIVTTLQLLGCSVLRLDQPVDLLIGYRGVTHLVEVKTPRSKASGTARGRLTGGQAAFMADWRGEPVELLWTPADAVALVKRWETGA